MKIDPFSYYFVFTNTLNLSNERWKLAYLDQYPNKKAYIGPGFKYYKRR